jgi:hypothetical protein
MRFMGLVKKWYKNHCYSILRLTIRKKTSYRGANLLTKIYCKSLQMHMMDMDVLLINGIPSSN